VLFQLSTISVVAVEQHNFTRETSLPFYNSMKWNTYLSGLSGIVKRTEITACVNYLNAHHASR